MKVKKSLGYIWDELLPMLYRNYIGIHDEIINLGSLKNSRLGAGGSTQIYVCIFSPPERLGEDHDSPI